MSLLEVKNLTIDLDVPAGALHAIRDVSFEVERGETLCIVGESGCGKSMTALSLMGLLPRVARHVSGEILFDGKDLMRAREEDLEALRGDRIAMIFQEPMTSLNPSFTIGDQMIEGFVQHKKGSTQEAKRRAIELLDKVGISAGEERLKQYPHELSGGLRQRVMIAMSLMCEPELIIADEPTTALDVTVQAQILSTLTKLCKELGLALVVITHDLGVVARIADRVAVMYAGQVVEYAGVDDVFERPEHPYTLGLQRCIPVPGATSSRRLEVIPGRVPSLVGQLTGCSFRNRCLYASQPCTETDIESRDANGNHRYRCLLEPGAARSAQGAQ
ncbi:ABC transporter ATP-binding protein [Thalassospiraceae bacterium LMO-JJ14]|nr:ABC transporter ATP-binding protein [Thalassospiraceae bacterium LMO-JJ14]